MTNELEAPTLRSVALRYLDGNAPISPDGAGPTDYLRQVLDEWSRLSSGRELDGPCLRERTFWFALYELEALVEDPVRGKPDPFEAIMLQNLAEVREILRNWQELPEIYFATRPGEM